MVWLACWDCKTASAVSRASMLNYAPSAAPLPTPDGGQVVGQFTTLAIGFAAFQVFTVDYERYSKVFDHRMIAVGVSPR